MSISGKQLADGQLAAAEADMYTVPGSTRTFLSGIVCNNTGAGDNTVVLYLTPSGGTSRCIAYMSLGTHQTMYFDERLILDAGDKIRGYATNATQVDYVICGAEETT